MKNHIRLIRLQRGIVRALPSGLRLVCVYDTSARAGVGVLTQMM